MQMTFVASIIELTPLLKKSALLELILALKMLIHPVSENVWIRIHKCFLMDPIELEQQCTYVRKKKLCLKERGVS
jgi:hypothetical protein